MEEETSKSNEEIRNEANQKYSLVTIADAAGYSFVCEIEKGQIGDRVDNLSRINGNVVILDGAVKRLFYDKCTVMIPYLFTPVQS